MIKEDARSTRGKIVNAVWRLFYERGYEDTTVEGIIKLFQTLKGSFYYYFDGKDAPLSTLSLLFDERYEELMDTLTPKVSAMDKLLFLNSEPFSMIENSISLDLLVRLLSTQLVTTGEKHLLNHNCTYYKLLCRIIAQGQESRELNAETNVNEMVKFYALSEHVPLYDRRLCIGEYSLRRYSASVIPAFLSHLLPGRG